MRSKRGEVREIGQTVRSSCDLYEGGVLETWSTREMDLIRRRSVGVSSESNGSSETSL